MPRIAKEVRGKVAERQRRASIGLGARAAGDRREGIGRVWVRLWDEGG